MARETAKDVDEAAAQWLARYDRGLTPEEEQEFQRWLAYDPRHLGAWGRLHALFVQSERLRVTSPQPTKSGVLPRRRLLQWGAAALGTAAAAGGATALWLLQSATRYSTRRGELRVLALADGSVATLNTATEIRVRFGARRAVELRGGEALFDVAKDPDRPFTVAANGLRLRALGTSFAVRALPDRPAQVLVREGVVEAQASVSDAAPAVRLGANTRGVLQANAVVATAASAEEVARELGWREGRIIFAGESLADACAEFARYADTRIVIADPALARQEVSGSFQATDPVGFGRAIAEALRVHVAVRDGEVRLFR